MLERDNHIQSVFCRRNYITSFSTDSSRSPSCPWGVFKRCGDAVTKLRRRNYKFLVVMAMLKLKAWDALPLACYYPSVPAKFHQFSNAITRSVLPSIAVSWQWLEDPRDAINKTGKGTRYARMLGNWQRSFVGAKVSLIGCFDVLTLALSLLICLATIPPRPASRWSGVKSSGCSRLASTRTLPFCILIWLRGKVACFETFSNRQAGGFLV